MNNLQNHNNNFQKLSTKNTNNNILGVTKSNPFFSKLIKLPFHNSSHDENILLNEINKNRLENLVFLEFSMNRINENNSEIELQHSLLNVANNSQISFSLNVFFIFNFIGSYT